MAFLFPRLRHTKRRAAIHANGHFWILLLFLAGTAPAWAELAPVRLQLKWQHQFQFAGYYATQAQGYYREAGLAVEILPCAPGDCVQKVLDGQAEYGVGTTDLLLRREQGAPVVVLAVIFQHIRRWLCSPCSTQGRSREITPFGGLRRGCLIRPACYGRCSLDEK